MKIYRYPERKDWPAILGRQKTGVSEQVRETVSKIISDIRSGGDAKVLEYTKSLDGYDTDARGLRLRPDHFSAPPTPYLVRTACGDILEVPLSVTPLLRRLPALLGRLPSALRQPAVGSFSRWGALALLPVEHPLRVMQYMTRRFVAAGGRILSLTWHSSEMMPGGAPHMPDEGHVTRFLEKIKKYIEWLPTIGDLRSVTMQEIRRELTVCPAPLPPATADWSVLPTEPFSVSPP